MLVSFDAMWVVRDGCFALALAGRIPANRRRREPVTDVAPGQTQVARQAGIRRGRSWRGSTALERGVDVPFLIPGQHNQGMVEGRRNPDAAPFWKSLGELGRHESFALVAIASHRGGGDHQHVYVHAKVARIDDVWATIGSTNIANRSFYGDTELNATLWHGPTVRALRCELLLEHIGHDTSALDDRAALRLYREVARENTRQRARGDAHEVLAFALDPATYAS